MKREGLDTQGSAIYGKFFLISISKHAEQPMECRPINRVLYGFLFSSYLQVPALISCTDTPTWWTIRSDSYLNLPDLCLMVEPVNSQPFPCYFSRIPRMQMCYSHSCSIITGNNVHDFFEKSSSFHRWHCALIVALIEQNHLASNAYPLFHNETRYDANILLFRILLSSDFCNLNTSEL